MVLCEDERGRVIDIEGMPQDERLAILAELAREHPGLNAPPTGALAGRATRDRPAVPVYEYLKYHEDNPSVWMTEMADVSFPVVFCGGARSTVALGAGFIAG